MFKLLVALALIGMVAGAMPQTERQTELESRIFTKGHPIKPEEVLTIVKELKDIYRMTRPTDMDMFMRKHIDILEMIGTITLENCYQLNHYNDLVAKVEKLDQLMKSTGEFVKVSHKKQNELCEKRV